MIPRRAALTSLAAAACARDPWAPLMAELELWRATGRKAAMWRRRRVPVALGVPPVYATKAMADAVASVDGMNGHIEMIDRKTSPSRCNEAAVNVGFILVHLSGKRRGSFEPTAPTGVVTHHHALDERCWTFLEELFDRLDRPRPSSGSIRKPFSWPVRDDA